jgi:hypothetical protein
VDVILALVGLGVVICALLSLFSPPKKHKEFSLHDRDEATIRAPGGSGPLDLSKLENPRRCVLSKVTPKSSDKPL